MNKKIPAEIAKGKYFNYVGKFLSFSDHLRTLFSKQCQIKSGRWDKFLWPSQNILTLRIMK